MRYGGYSLRRGDRDSNATYQGIQRSAVKDVIPTVGEVGFVRQLQEDLRDLGFRLVGGTDGVFGLRTEQALREFQIYSKMPRVAMQTGAAPRYSDSLRGVENPHVYSGPVSGVANTETRNQLMNWIDHSFRCPLVIESWKMKDGRRVAMFRGSDDAFAEACQNLWGHDELKSSSPRMFARDFSGYYDIPDSRAKDEVITLGEHRTYGSNSGPRSVPPIHTWPESEMLPESLTGAKLANMSDSQRSTYKVIRAVAEVECMGFFDSINAYDNAILSLGPCHWTLGIVSANGSVSEGELCAFLAYLRHADPKAYEKAFGFFGVEIDENWVDDSGIPSGARLWTSGSRKYTGWLAQQREDRTFERLVNQEPNANYFKHWHWFYRMMMAARTMPGFRMRMYDFARVRIRDILKTKFQEGVSGLPTDATLKDVFTSEKAVALLLRWHIRYPALLANGGRVASTYRNSTVGTVQTAFDNAQLVGDPSDWGNAEEAALINGIMSEVNHLGNKNFLDTMSYVHEWPSNWARKSRRYQIPKSLDHLSTDRHSFQFDKTELPPTPESK